jgi:hypothetical protein
MKKLSRDQKEVRKQVLKSSSVKVLGSVSAETKGSFAGYYLDYPTYRKNKYP